MENGTQMTLEEYMPEIFQKQIAGVLDSHVKSYVPYRTTRRRK